MKVNAEVLDDSARLQSMGIPTFAGVPVVRSFLELAGDFECRWFAIHAAEGMQSDSYFSSAVDVSMDDRVQGPLDQDCICQIIRDQGRVLEWGDAIERMSEIRAVRNALYGRLLFGPNYKPVYFFIPDGPRNAGS